jgi:hypothetical protein
MRHIAGHENKDLLSEAINSFRVFDILKLWEAVHLPMGSCSRKVNEE